jgi:plasmid stabilization system protein ParE
LILYRIIPKGVQIVRVLHGAQNIDDSLFNEGVD